jgi:hypothetical protein
MRKYRNPIGHGWEATGGIGNFPYEKRGICQARQGDKETYGTASINQEWVAWNGRYNPFRVDPFLPSLPKRVLRKSSGQTGQSGRRMSVVDSLIAATARCHGLTIATRKIDDFRRCKMPVLNPWAEEKR